MPSARVLSSPFPIPLQLTREFLESLGEEVLVAKKLKGELAKLRVKDRNKHEAFLRNSMGTFYYDNGKLKEAQVHYERAIAAWVRSKESLDAKYQVAGDFIDGLKLKNNLANVLKDRAEHTIVLARLHTQRPEEVPGIDTGFFAERMEGLEEAVDLYKEVMDARVKADPAYHNTETIRSVNNYAAVLGVKIGDANGWTGGEKAWNLDEAKKHFETALLKRLRHSEIGPEHKDTLRTLEGRAKLLLAEGKYPEAATEWRQVIRGREANKDLGPNHRQTYVAYTGLGQARHWRGFVTLDARLRNDSLTIVCLSFLMTDRNLLAGGAQAYLGLGDLAQAKLELQVATNGLQATGVGEEWYKDFDVATARAAWFEYEKKQGEEAAEKRKSAASK